MVFHHSRHAPASKGNRLRLSTLEMVDVDDVSVHALSLFKIEQFLIDGAALLAVNGYHLLVGREHEVLIYIVVKDLVELVGALSLKARHVLPYELVTKLINLLGVPSFQLLNDLSLFNSKF